MIESILGILVALLIAIAIVFGVVWLLDQQEDNSDFEIEIGMVRQVIT